MKTFFSKIRAFTLVEVLIVVVMAAIILSLGVPAFRGFIQNNYSVSISNNLDAALRYARSEAIRRNNPVTICATADSNFSSCGSAWNLGWIIFNDINGDSLLTSGQDTILRVERLTGSNASVVPSTGTNTITYNNAGFPNANASNVTFTISATGCTGNYARTINISVTGLLTIAPASCP